jgi:membrane-associated protease RseP (regulator of RpoE activity)
MRNNKYFPEFQDILFWSFRSLLDLDGSHIAVLTYQSWKEEISGHEKVLFITQNILSIGDFILIFLAWSFLLMMLC